MFTSLVTTGFGLGRRLGFPTANLKNFPHDLSEGIYACLVQIKQKTFAGVFFLGKRQTLGNEKLTAEAHLFDFTENLVGQKISVQIIAYLRAPKKFSSLEKLRQAIAKDCARAKKLIQKGSESTRQQSAKIIIN